MSLYYEAASVLANSDNAGGSLKSRLYRQTDLKSSPAQLFALISEASKWSLVLKDVIEKCGLLREEKKLTPILALLLCHDLIVSKNGVAAPANHVLKLAISRHKARLSAEFTKARIRRGYPTLESFRGAVNDGALEEQPSSGVKTKHPRWIRVNTLKTNLEELITTNFAEYEKAETLSQVMAASGSTKIYFRDPNIPNLLAFPPKIDISKSSVYTSGKIILQDKASCFPAYLLNVAPGDGDIIDGCAAPGNKTTHLAALVSSCTSDNQKPSKVIAFERDKTRANILQKMVKLAAADGITSVKAGADFLAASPGTEEFSNVGAILLDPSCSGSGIVGRDDSVQMHLPDASSQSAAVPGSQSSKKRKRTDPSKPKVEPTTAVNFALDDSANEETPLEEDKTSERLTALSTFQLRILTHAMHFPNAHKITYSTCSIHFEENEGVVARALASPVAQSRGWRILSRAEQVDGLRQWQRRGLWEDEKFGEQAELDHDQKQLISDACIRCEKGTEEGTMGFFVAALVRDAGPNFNSGTATLHHTADDSEEWKGFDDVDVTEDKPIRSVSPTSQHSKKKRKKARKNRV
ncbi:unnamed protein product [Periconia digitata]|uniref:SAM-dependent MTase RsmB/NOP-type domain-containing protein n=1 Tax=Periconia digitata TaxID=1303443 RepID=A0A9W4UIV8_9PLEO|nr:unnamed protein product [Periconia digitata]